VNEKASGFGMLGAGVVMASGGDYSLGVQAVAGIASIAAGIMVMARVIFARQEKRIVELERHEAEYQKDLARLGAAALADARKEIDALKAEVYSLKLTGRNKPC
jgi:uncharacterized coiled-coil protein SlyX